MSTNTVINQRNKYPDGRVQPSGTAPRIKRIERDNPFEGKDEPTILIIGGGTFGVSTAYHLAHVYQDPSKVTVIDRSPSPPYPAAAIDINRVIRTDYPNQFYCNLAHESIHPWFWSGELGPTFNKVGWFMFNEEGSDIANRICNTFTERGSNWAEDVQLNELGQRFDGILNQTETKGFSHAYFNPEAGWVNAAVATHNFITAAEKRGVKRVTADATELLFESSAGRIKGVRTADGQTYFADKVILASGAWTSQLMSPVEDQLDIADKDRIETQARATGTVSAYYRLSVDETAKLIKAKMPVIVYGGNGEIFPPSKENQLLKISNSITTFTNTITTKSGRRISVPRVDQYNVPESIKRETEAIMSSKVLPKYVRGKKPDYWRICYDTQTPTEDLLMCKHPNAKLSNLYLALGGSFHSYK